MSGSRGNMSIHHLFHAEGLVLFAQGLVLIFFSRRTNLVSATAAFLVFGLLVCMACGVTYAIVPLVRPGAVGSASGIVGAGGNVGALLASFLFKWERLTGPNAFLILGVSVAVSAFFVLLLRFQDTGSQIVFDETELALAQSAD